MYQIVFTLDEINTLIDSLEYHKEGCDLALAVDSELETKELTKEIEDISALLEKVRSVILAK